MLIKKVVTDRLKGQVAFTESMWEEDGLHFSGLYRCIIDNTELAKGLQPNDVSVIYNIHCLHAKIQVAETEAACSGFVYLDHKKRGRTVHLCSPDSSGPEISLKLIKQELTNLDSMKWTLETLKEKIPAECKSAINHEESCPDIEAGYLSTIKKFEV